MVCIAVISVVMPQLLKVPTATCPHVCCGGFRIGNSISIVDITQRGRCAIAVLLGLQMVTSLISVAFPPTIPVTTVILLDTLALS